MKGFALCAIVAVALVATAQADAKYDAQVYFKKHFPNKLDKMDKLFEQYAGKEDQLMKTLIKNRATVVVTTHYSKYKPSRGSKVREIIAATQDYDALIADLQQRETDIEATRAKIESFYNTNDMQDRLSSVDSMLQRAYGREDQLWQKIQDEGVFDGAGRKVRPKTFSTSTGGYIDLIVAVGMAFFLFTAFAKLIPMMEANLGGTKEKKDKRKPNPSGNNKKKR